MHGIDLSHISVLGLKPGHREDDRKWNEFRSLIISNNAVGTAPASASVRLGNTFVLAGISTNLTTPDRETPDTGSVQLRVDVTPLASPSRTRLQAVDTAATLSHILTLHFTNPYVLDSSSLCVQSGQHCWAVHVDICVLNDDGGLLDACMAAASSALKSLQLPDMKEHPDTHKLVHREVDGNKKYVPLDLQATPLTMTFGIFADTLLFDPCQQEADQLASLIQVTVAGGGHCSGIELHSKSDVCQTLLKEAVQHAHARYAAVQAMFA